ncbi:MAG: hypothetical protein ACR2NZ_15595 [Rubripirellula sp.]
MTEENLSPFTSGMQAEAGYELDDSTAPLRVSGFLCLLFGLLSVLSVLGKPLLLLPLIAFVLGAIALRKTSGPTPVGTKAACIGLVLAVGFGACGYFVPWMKTRTLGNQAEKFARDYMETIARGHDEFAMELEKDYVNRMSTEMSLQEHYSADERAGERLMEFKNSPVTKALQQRGPDAEWVLERPTRIYYSYRREHAELVWMDPTGESPVRIQMFMEYVLDSKGMGQWHMATVQPLRRRIVAESVL